MNRTSSRIITLKSILLERKLSRGTERYADMYMNQMNESKNRSRIFDET